MYRNTLARIAAVTGGPGVEGCADTVLAIHLLEHLDAEHHGGWLVIDEP